MIVVAGASPAKHLRRCQDLVNSTIHEFGVCNIHHYRHPGIENCLILSRYLLVPVSHELLIERGLKAAHIPQLRMCPKEFKSRWRGGLALGVSNGPDPIVI